MKHGKSPYTSPSYVWNASSALFYAASRTAFHSHNTMQLVLDTQKTFKFRVQHGSWGTYKCLVIKENVVHQLDTNNSVQLIIYLDAESKFARAIKSWFLLENDIYSPDLNVFHLVNSNELEQALVNPEPGRMKNLIDKIVGCLSREVEVASADERIVLIEQAISTMHPEEVTLRSLAEKVYLSESRLRSLFKKVTGLSLHQYVLWNKIRFATNQIMAGNSVNDAALEAGFSDSSHFHKMMVRMLGKSPSTFLKNNYPGRRVQCDKEALHFETSYY